MFLDEEEELEGQEEDEDLLLLKQLETTVVPLEEEEEEVEEEEEEVEEGPDEELPEDSLGANTQEQTAPLSEELDSQLLNLFGEIDDNKLLYGSPEEVEIEMAKLEGRDAGQQEEAAIRLLRNDGVSPLKDLQLTATSYVRSIMETLSPTASLPDTWDEWLQTHSGASGGDSVNETAAAGLGEGMGSASIAGGGALAGAGVGAMIGAGTGPGAVLTTAAGAAVGAVSATVLNIVQGSRREANSARYEALINGLSEEEAEDHADTAFYMSLGFEAVGSIPLVGAPLKSSIKVLKKSLVKAGISTASEVTEDAAKKITKDAAKEFSKDLTFTGKVLDRLSNSATITKGIAAEGLTEAATDIAITADLESTLNGSDYLKEAIDAATSPQAFNSFVGGAFGGAAGVVTGRVADKKLDDFYKKELAKIEIEETIRLNSIGKSLTPERQKVQEDTTAIVAAVKDLKDDDTPTNSVVLDNITVDRATLESILEEEPELVVRTVKLPSKDDKGKTIKLEDGTPATIERLAIERVNAIEPVDLEYKGLLSERSELDTELAEIEAQIDSDRANGTLLVSAGELARRDTLRAQSSQVSKELSRAKDSVDLRNANKELAKVNQQILNDPENLDLVTKKAAVQESVGNLRARLANTEEVETATLEPKQIKTVPEQITDIIKEKLGDKLVETPISELTVEEQDYARQILNSYRTADKKVADPALESRRSELEKSSQERYAKFREEQEFNQELKQEEEVKVKEQTFLDSLSEEDLLTKVTENPTEESLTDILSEIEKIESYAKDNELPKKAADRLQELRAVEQLVVEEESKAATKQSEVAAKEKAAAEESKFKELEGRRVLTDRQFKNLSPDARKVVPKNASLNTLKRKVDSAKSEKSRGLFQEAIDTLEASKEWVVRQAASDKSTPAKEALSKEISNREEQLKEVKLQKSYAESQGDTSELSNLVRTEKKLISDIQDLKRAVRNLSPKKIKVSDPRLVMQQNMSSYQREALYSSDPTVVNFMEEMSFESPFLAEAGILTSFPEGRKVITDYYAQVTSTEGIGNYDYINLTDEEARTVHRLKETDLGDASPLLSPRAVKWALYKVAANIDGYTSISRDRKLQKTGILGIYSNLTRQITTKSHLSLAATAHEIGHSLWRTVVGWGGKDIENIHTNVDISLELSKLGSTYLVEDANTAEAITEGFSEFFRLYTTKVDGKEKLKKAAPNTYAWFENNVLPTIPGLQTSIATATKLGRQYDGLDPASMIGSKLLDYNKVPIKQKFEERITAFLGLTREFVKTQVDEHAVYHWFNRNLEELVGKPMPLDKNLGAMRDASRTQVGSIMKSWVMGRPSNKVGQAVPNSKNLTEVLHPVRKTENGDLILQKYLYANRTLQEEALHQEEMVKWNERKAEYDRARIANASSKQVYEDRLERWHKAKAKGDKSAKRPSAPSQIEVTAPGPRPVFKETGFGIEESRETIARVDKEAPEIAVAARNLDIWFEGILKVAASFSPVTAQKIHAIREGNGTQFIYVPLKYLGQLKIDTTKQRKGSDSDVQNPVKAITQVAESFLELGVHNWLTDSLHDISKDPNAAPLVSPVSTKEQQKLMKEYGLEEMFKDVEAKVAEFGLEYDTEEGKIAVSDSIMDRIMAEVKFFQVSGNNEQVVVPIRVYDEEAGKPVLKLYKVQRELAVSLFKLEGHDFLSQIGKMYDSLSNIKLGNTGLRLKDTTQIFKLGVTGANLSFAALNLVRDAALAARNSQSTAMTLLKIPSYVTALSRLFLNKTSGGYILDSSPDLNFLEASGISTSSFLAMDNKASRFVDKSLGKAKLKNMYFSGLEYLTDVLSTPELAPRLTEINLLAKERGIDLSQPITTEQFILLATAGKNITVDFHRAGSHARVYNKLLPFWNPQIQGNVTLYKQLRDNPMRYMSRAMQQYALHLAMYMQYKDDEWYKEMPKVYKYLFTWIPEYNEESKLTELWRIPRLHAEDFMLAAVQIAIDSINDENVAAADETADLFFNHLWPVNIYNMATGGAMGAWVETLRMVPHAFRTPLEVSTNVDAFLETAIEPRYARIGGTKLPEEIISPYTSRTAKYLATTSLARQFEKSPIQIDRYFRGYFGKAGEGMLNSIEYALGAADESGPTREGFFSSVKYAFKQKSGLLPSRMRSVQKFYENRDALKKQSSYETEEEGQLRLQTEDAGKAIHGIGAMLPYIKDPVEMHGLRTLMLGIAKEANAAIEDHYIDRKIFKEYKQEIKEISKDVVPEALTKEEKREIIDAEKNQPGVVDRLLEFFTIPEAHAVDFEYVKTSKGKTIPTPESKAVIKEYASTILEVINPDMRELALAIMETESNFNPKAVSGAGASGLMQLMPAIQKTLGVKDPFSIKQNIRAGVELLEEEIDRFGDLSLAIAAYNAGSPSINKAIKKAGSRDWKKVSRYLAEETRNYVPKVREKYEAYMSKGLGDDEE